tara:strand:+ start:2437 stop:2775 length:339 start_codon:yes stop_codon:yes gene_type:complete
MFRISIIVFLFFIINVRDVEANKLHAAPALETINVNGKIEFSGFYTNIGIESNIFLKFIAKDKYGEIIEAAKIPINSNSAKVLGRSDKIYYNFVIASNPSDIHSKELYFTSE